MAVTNIHVEFGVPQTTLDITTLTNGIFQTVGVRYGFMPQVMEDAMIKTATLTLCGRKPRPTTRRGLSLEERIEVTGFIHGFAHGRGFTVKTEWEVLL